MTATLTLSACGGGDDDRGELLSGQSRASASASASAGTGSAPSASASAGSDEASATAPDDLDQSSFFATVLAAQSKAGTAHITMEYGGGGQQINAEGDVKLGADSKDTSLAMTMNIGPQKLELRLLDRIFYLNFGMATQNKFAAIGLDDGNSVIVQQYVTLLNSIDPNEQLADLQNAVVSLQPKGSPENLDGVSAQPYEITVDVAKMPQITAAPGTNRVTYTVWIGPDNLVRKSYVDIAGTTSTIQFSQWGDKVSIVKPAADQITTSTPFG